MVFQGQAKPPSLTLQEATLYLSEYKRVHLCVEGRGAYCNSIRRYLGKWKPLEGEWCKLNVHAAVKEGHEWWGIGVIYRNNAGKMVKAFSKSICGNVAPFIGECLAIMEGLKFAIEHNLPISIVETDCNINAIEAINNPSLRALKELAREAVLNFHDFTWGDDPPDSITACISADVE